MSDDRWTRVDDYFAEAMLPPDPVLQAALAASERAGLPPIQVAPNQGKLLQLLARMIGAQRILEIGTLGGYSTIWLARALPPGGRLLTLELDPKHAQVAAENFRRAQLDGVIELRLGPAADTLARLVAEGQPPFDFVFIDADKASIPDYFQWSLRLARRGAAIVVDNVARRGAVIDADSRDANVLGVRRFRDLLASETRVSATAVQTVGTKGYDGFVLALVVA
jgi:predicted O-methyltransferase YrrM